MLMQQKPVQNNADASLHPFNHQNNISDTKDGKVEEETKPEVDSSVSSDGGGDKCSSKIALQSDPPNAESNQSITEESTQNDSSLLSSTDTGVSEPATTTDLGVSKSSNSSDQVETETSLMADDPNRDLSEPSQSKVPEMNCQNLLKETEENNDSSEKQTLGSNDVMNNDSKTERNCVGDDSSKVSCLEREDGLNCCPPSEVPNNEADLCMNESSLNQNESAKPIDDSSNSFPASVDNSHNSFNEMNDSGQSNDDLSDYISGMKGVFDFLPSVSEVQRLLPGIIQSVTGGGLEEANESFERDVSSFRMPPNVIVEPKRLDREECRVNLIQHVENLQGLVEDSFDKIDARLIALESGEEVPPLDETDTHFPRTKTVLTLLLRDLKTAKKLNLSLPEKI